MGTPTDARMAIIDRLVNKLEVIDVFKTFDWIMFGAGEDKAQALVSLVNPVTYRIAETVAPITFNANSGFASSGSGNAGSYSYLDGFYNPTTAGIKFQKNAHCFGIVNLTEESSDNTGMCGTEFYGLNPRSVAGQIRCRSGSSTTDTLATPAAKGVVYINRHTSAGFNLGHVDLTASPTQTSAAKVRATAASITSQNWSLCGQNLTGANQFSTRTLAMAWAGADWGDHQVMPTIAAFREALVAVGAV